MSPTYKYDVFVSHNRKDKWWVKAFVEELREKASLVVFFDEDSITPGRILNAEIGDALDASRSIVLVLTHASLDSQWVALETAVAVHSAPSGGRLVPVRLEDVPLESIPATVRVLEILDLYSPSSEITEYRRLLRSVRVDAETAARMYPPKPVPPAAEDTRMTDSELPKESLYARKRTRDLIMARFPRRLCDLAKYWTRKDVSLSVLAKTASMYHPESGPEITHELFDALSGAYDEKYGSIRGDEDERSLAPNRWEAEYWGILNEMGLDWAQRPSMIDVGIGSGREWANFYSGWSEILGVDISKAALESTKALHPSLEVLHADAADLSAVPSGSYDVYISLRTFQSTLFDIESSLLEATRVLRPRGLLLISLSDAHRVKGGIVRGILESDGLEVDFDLPYILAERVRRHLNALAYSNIGVRTGLFEVYVYGRRP